MFSGTIPILNITLLLTKSTLSVEIVLISSPNAVYLNYFSYLCSVRAAKRQTDNNRQFKEIIQIMATYTITLNERSARGKALMEYLKALGVLMHKVSPKSATKHRLYDPETGEYLNDETMKAIEQAHDDMKHGRLKTYSSADEMFKDLGINV